MTRSKSKIIFELGGLGVLSLQFFGAFALSQVPPVLPSFDVASFKLMSGPCSHTLPCAFGEDSVQTTPTGFACHGCPLGYLIRWAYGLHLYHPNETVGPDWIEPGNNWVRYDVVAKTDHPALAGDLRLMLRALLAERLKMALHREPKEMPVYVLSVGSGELKLRPSKDEGEAKFTPPPPGSDGIWWWGVWHFERYQLDGLYEFLWRFLPTPIVDETGIPGRFDFDLNMGKYRDYYEVPLPGNRADLGPVLNRALQEVGLKLEQKRRPVEVLLIDHVEKTPLEAPAFQTDPLPNPG
jgi:uncharacterized protein (TIGR03435 family)